MFCELALRVSQKVLIKNTQFIYVGVCNELQSKKLINKKKIHFFSLHFFYNFVKKMLPMLIVVGLNNLSV